MIISTINGSPKQKESNSCRYIAAATNQLKDRHTIQDYSVAKSSLSEEEISNIMQSEILLVAFPLYVDGIPVNMLKQLILLEKAFKEKKHKDTMVYVIVNNGFYEGEQNEHAIEMVMNFCKRAGLSFGQGIGIGTGEMQGQMLQQGMPLGKAVLTNLGKTMSIFIHNIEERKSAPSLYVRPNFSWRGFQFMAHHTFWNSQAKANGLSKKDMNRRMVYKKG